MYFRADLPEDNIANILCSYIIPIRQVISRRYFGVVVGGIGDIFHTGVAEPTLFYKNVDILLVSFFLLFIRYIVATPIHG